MNNNNNKPSKDDVQIPLLSKDTPTVDRPSRITFRSHFLEYLSEFSSPTKYIVKYSSLSYIAFWDLWSYIRKINSTKVPTTLQDLPLPFNYFNIESKVVLLDQKWIEEKNRGSPSYVRALYKTYKTEFYKTGILMFVIFNSRLITTVILGKLIYLISKGTLTEQLETEQLVMQGVYFAVLFLATNITNTHYWNYNTLLGARVRLSTVALVYKKLQSTALSSLQEINIGKVINLLASDLNDVDFGFSFLWPFLLVPITLGLAAYTIWDYFEYFTLISIGWLVVSLILSNKISELTKNPRIEKNAISDQRVKLSNEIIECIRLIKMYAWDRPFRKNIEDLRHKEFIGYLRLFSLQALGRSVTDSSVFMSAFLMFLCYVLAGGILTPEKVFSTIMMLTFVRLWCVGFPYMGRTFIVNGRVMQKRVEDILNIPDVLTVEEVSGKERRSMSGNNEMTTVKTMRSKQPLAPVQFKRYTAYWTASAQKACLDDISLTLRPGEVTAVIGKIGSGKTTFLLSFLREIPRTQGDLILDGTIAYVEQEPIIFSGSVRENILFGQPFDDNLYQKVIRACSLLSDFTQLSDGDQTLVGEKGVTLSGGQKARLSLARALYSNSDIYLLDDPLSAVDSKVARHLFTYAIKGDLLKDKIVVLVTHHISFAKETDRMVVFDEGKVIAQGSFDELASQQLDLLSLFNKETKVYEETRKKGTSGRKSSIVVKKSSFREDGSMAEEEEEEEVPLGNEKKEFKEEETQVTFATYKNYLKAGGRWGLLMITICCFVIFQICQIGFSRFMGQWALKHQEHYIFTGTTEGFDHTQYIIGGILITITFLLTSYLRIYLCGRFFVDCDNKIHAIMLMKITRTFAAFFDKTPIGSILNRFSNDLGLLDKVNWETFHNVMWGTCYMSFSIGTICYINPYVLIPSIIILLGLVRIRNFFARSSVETKRLDLMSRSPLYSEISATVNGLLIIRVFRQGGRFVQNFMNVIYNNSKCLLFMQRTQGVFGMVIDLWLYVLTVTGLFLYIYIALTATIDPSLFGLAMVLFLDMCNGSSFVVKQSLQLDVNMQSAERVLGYCKLPEEAPLHKDKDEIVKRDSNGKWPYRGEIKFKNVYMRYGSDTNIYAVNGLTFDINAGTKIGVVGRTGAGKSSIIQVLFRMVEIEKTPGSEIVIDGVNIGELGLDYLRKSLSIIPQTAVIFTGTIRRNLDPFGEFGDADLWQVLEEVKLKIYVERLEKKLETDMTLSSSVFSAGQKQLICLARAILRRSRIIMLDEATANVDIETDNFIQDKINEKFGDCTIITIAHRLTTIAHYDKVLVMEKGRVVEYNAPYLLLVEKEGDRRITNTQGWFAKMVISTGENTAKRIFEIAYQHYGNAKKF